MSGRYQDWTKRGGGHIHMNMENKEQQCDSENGYLRSDNAFGSVRHVVLDELFKGASIRLHSEGLSSICATRILHQEKHILISTVLVVE